MAYIEKSLSAGESIHAQFRLHWFVWVPAVFWLLVALALIAVGALLGVVEPLAIAALVAGVLVLMYALFRMVRLMSIEQGVTNKRVIIKRGIISRNTDEMKLASIETVEIDQGVLGRIFGFGTIKITGRGISDVVFQSIDDPMAVKRQIESVSNPVV